MQKDLLDGLTPFLAVAEHKSFTTAAAKLGVTPTAVSKAIRQLEQRHEVILFQRTTRRVALTEAGASLYARLRPAAEEIGEAFAALSGYADHPVGTLRLTVPRAVSALLVEPIVLQFRRSYPDVTLDLTLDDGAVDLMQGNYDAGIRLGESVAKDMVAIRLTPEITWSVVGAPAYFARAGRPRTPEELTHHEGILYRFVTSGVPHRWEFERDKREILIDIKGKIMVNDRAPLLAFARQGLGLAYMADFEVGHDLATGRLEQVLKSFIPANAGLYLYFPTRTQTQPKLRAFIDMATKLSAQPGFMDLLRGRA